MNYRELDELVVQLKKIFDVVRLVDVDKTEVVMPEQSHACYAVWNRQERCEKLYLCQSRCPEVPADKDRICRLQNISCDLSLCGNRWKGICFRDGNRDPG